MEGLLAQCLDKKTGARSKWQQPARERRYVLEPPGIVWGPGFQKPNSGPSSPPAGLAGVGEDHAVLS